MALHAAWYTEEGEKKSGKMQIYAMQMRRKPWMLRVNYDKIFPELTHGGKRI
jgi:hypothetical protein